ncbi:Crp/Fnr family transcriptional regulator [Yinghuangia seranimata]|uniref:Crp/Fnr family transcriptional regulator n=1 Tax=Yinghuangia seranimata TaxID=408067 RepID=UPI00248C13B3|nr:Crp/Fnr family transcriptional regulator [Yinghuangia seranimata]MDI2132557.1 Crp/Fnr family transcriptional regulator [Yinghuangia seranimata]
MAEPHAGERLTAAEIDEWKVQGRERRYGDGQVLMRQGDPAEHGLLLTAGRVKVVASSEDGHDVVLAYREPGEIFGELAVLDGGTHSATVYAIGPVEVWAMSPEGFLSYLQQQPRVSVALLLVMIRRLRQADTHRLRYRAQTVVQRVAERLLHLADQCGVQTREGIRLEMRLTYPELAAAVAASRESAVKAVASLRSAGALATGRDRRFVITEPDLLRRIASHGLTDPSVSG